MKPCDLKWSDLSAEEEAGLTLTSGGCGGGVLVMVLAVEILEENFTYGLSWNLQWYPQTQANYNEEFSTVPELIPNSLA